MRLLTCVASLHSQCPNIAIVDSHSSRSSIPLDGWAGHAKPLRFEVAESIVSVSENPVIYLEGARLIHGARSLDEHLLIARWSHHHAVSCQTADTQQDHLCITLRRHEAMQIAICASSTSVRE